MGSPPLDSLPLADPCTQHTLICDRSVTFDAYPRVRPPAMNDQFGRPYRGLDVIRAKIIQNTPHPGGDPAEAPSLGLALNRRERLMAGGRLVPELVLACALGQDDDLRFAGNSGSHS